MSDRVALLRAALGDAGHVVNDARDGRHEPRYEPDDQQVCRGLKEARPGHKASCQVEAERTREECDREMYEHHMSGVPR